MGFKDHFSGHAKIYAAFRPTYPEELYERITDLVHQRHRAWDCGTGNGQVAVHLAERFGEVMASDASRQQIDHAEPHPKVVYKVAKAENSGYDDQAFDLITVGQAMHWFHFEEFFREVRRVARPGCVFSCWTYRFLTIDPELDRVLEKFFDLIETYWPPERDHVEARYSTIPFPDDFEVIPFEQIHIERDIPPEKVLNYLRTWSSVKNFRQENGEDPLLHIEEEFMYVWGDQPLRRVTHPMVTKVFRIYE